MSNDLERLSSALPAGYQIERELGAGGMATVYLAQDIKHDRKVAVKVLRPELAAVLGGERFLNEIKVTANLQHPHILPLFDSGRTDGPAGEAPDGRRAGFLYYVMPYVSGGSLREKLKTEGRFSIEETLRITTQVADALASAHRQGVIHRDIKPENILLREGNAVVADFGIALAVSSAGGDRLTETGLSLGTPAYMSPEQVAGEREIDARSDIYSLACVLYEMLAADPPFVASNPRAVLAKHLADPVPPITTVRPNVAPSVASALERALAKEPADRFPSASEFSKGLFTEPKKTEPEVKSVAVLPFENLSADPENEYFSDGVTEDIIACLSQIGSLRVISRTSSNRYKDSELGIRDIAEALGASHVVEGSVRKAGDQLRIVAQLIEASTDAHIWSQTFDRRLADVFAIQSEVAERIAGALRARMSPDVRRRFGRRPTGNQAAYNAYILARHHFNFATAEGSDTAIGLCREAVEKDPTFANAWASIAVAHHYHLCGYFGMRPRDAAAEIVENASRALELDPYIAEAHMILGEVEGWVNLNWEAARIRHERALELSPNLAVAHRLYGNYLACVGRLDEAVEAGHRALELDPEAEVSHIHSSFLCYVAGEFDKAFAGLDAAEAQFGLSLHQITRGETLIAVGRADEAVELFRDLCVRIPGSWYRIHLAWGLAAAGEDTEAREVLSQLHELGKREYLWHLGIAAAYAHLGEMDEAFRYLNRSFEEREAWTAFSLAPTFDPFRDDPRFGDLVERIGALGPRPKD